MFAGKTPGSPRPCPTGRRGAPCYFGPVRRDLDDRIRELESARTVRITGRVRSLVGLAVRATAPGAKVGELVHILRRGGEPPLPAEVVGFMDEDALVLPLGAAEGVGPEDAVECSGSPLRIRCSNALLGRVLDGLGAPMDGGATLVGDTWDVVRPAPSPLDRHRIARALPTGVRAIDALLTFGEGQRVGLFAGSGVGKSTLLGQIARGAEADVVVVCLVGERGREVREFLDESLGSEGLARAVVVCATSDQPALVRMKSAHTATAIAEWFRGQGKRVLLLMDSVTRFARAAREVGLAAGEPPARRGYPPSAFAALPALLERSGTGGTGSITAIYTVLVEGNDMEEPIADEVRGILDGHVVLSRALAERGRFPAIDVGQSLSRVMGAITTDTQRAHATRLRAWIAHYEDKRDLVLLGAYKAGADALLDEALARQGNIERFLAQPSHEHIALNDSVDALAALVGGRPN
ncbi:MAG: FliI/YscN family ATPase [Myxococcales bacterium]|nr:FliI/YscN family ATPase [Myxococcales bacterium]